MRENHGDAIAFMSFPVSITWYDGFLISLLLYLFERNNWQDSSKFFLIYGTLDNACVTSVI